MKKHPILYLAVFKRQFEETALCFQSIFKTDKFGYYFLVSIILFISSVFFFYLGFVNDSTFFQVSFFISSFFLLVMAVLFLTLSYSKKFPQLNSAKNHSKKENSISENDGAAKKSNTFDDEFIDKLSIVLEKYKIYGKEREKFGLPNFEFESKTQLTVLLIVIKFNSHKDRFSNINQKLFVEDFKYHLEYISVTYAWFSTVKTDLFLFNRKKNILDLNEHSQYYKLYNEFSKIILTENI